MTDNLRHWNVLSKTDPKHTKSFKRSGGFKGTATKPIWTEYRLTEHFGPCGIGWGCEAPKFELVPANDEILVFCTVSAWYQDGESRATVYGVGGDKVLVKQQSGLHTDDEAYKKAFTDALGNAFKHVGSGADVHMGQFEDSKYVSAMRREFEDETQAAPAPHATLATMPPHPEEPPEAAAARQRIRELIDMVDRHIKNAPSRSVLLQVMDDVQNFLDEIEAAGSKGNDAAKALRRKANIRLAQFEEAA